MALEELGSDERSSARAKRSNGKERRGIARKGEAE